MRAVNNFIVLKAHKVSVKNIGGLIVHEKLDEANRYVKGEIISAGNLVQGLNEGDIILFDKHAGHGVEFNDELYHVIRDRDVVMVEE